MIRAKISFSLPEDPEADKLIVSTSPSRDGSYDVHDELDYSYGINKVDVDIEPDQWYRIQFANTEDGTEGVPSEPVYGGNFSNSAPFLVVSSSSDGAYYATTQDVYEYSGLSPRDIDPSNVGAALRRARAIIDYRTADLGMDRFMSFDDKVRRRKYNATLRLIQEAEICISLSSVYTAISDDLILKSMREGDDAPSSGSVSIGGTSVTGMSLAERSESILYLAALAERYEQRAESIMRSLEPSNIHLVSYEHWARSPKFKMP